MLVFNTSCDFLIKLVDFVVFAVFAYNLETCAHNRHKCSSFADCRDYSDGYCCRCRPGFYGNGKDCVAEGEEYLNSFSSPLLVLFNTQLLLNERFLVFQENPRE